MPFGIPLFLSLSLHRFVFSALYLSTSERSIVIFPQSFLPVFVGFACILIIWYSSEVLSSCLSGSALYQEKQVLDVFKDLALNVFGNAHSRNPSAKLTGERAALLPSPFFSSPSSSESPPIVTRCPKGRPRLPATQPTIVGDVYCAKSDRSHEEGGGEGAGGRCAGGDLDILRYMFLLLPLSYFASIFSSLDERTREARALTQKFFGATDEEFAVVFTSGNQLIAATKKTFSLF